MRVYKLAIYHNGQRIGSHDYYDYTKREAYRRIRERYNLVGKRDVDIVEQNYPSFRGQ